jgi:hypothetical protein
VYGWGIERRVFRCPNRTHAAPTPKAAFKKEPAKWFTWAASGGLGMARQLRPAPFRFLEGNV